MFESLIHIKLSLICQLPYSGSCYVGQNETVSLGKRISLGLQIV